MSKSSGRARFWTGKLDPDSESAIPDNPGVGLPQFDGPRDRQEDFARLHPCPNCGRNYYYVRHNMGAMTLDDLYFPWPPHSMFCPHSGFKTYHGTIKYSVNQWFAEEELTDIFVGIGVEISSDGHMSELTVKLTDNTEKTLLIEQSLHNRFLNELVIFSTKSRRLVRPYFSQDKAVLVEIKD